MKAHKPLFAAVSLLAVAAFTPASLLQAGQETSSGKKVVAPPIQAAAPCFADREFSIDTFGLYQTAESGTPYDDGFGGGVALNYFFTRNVGLSLEGYWSDASVDSTVVHSVTGSVVVRFPIDEICLAPYIFGGGGGHFDSENNASGHVGGGLEYRFNPSVGIFGDARYVWIGDDANDVGLYRVGLRFAF